MARTSIFNLAVISVALFGFLTVNALTELDEEEDRSYSDYEEDLEGLKQFEDNSFDEFESRYYDNQQSTGFCAGKKDGNYINPSNPHSFYQCHQNGATLLLPCVSGTVYDPPPRDRCEWPNQVQGCNGRYGNCRDKEPIIVLPTTFPPHSGRKGECNDRPQCKSCKPPTVPSYRPPSRRNARDTRRLRENLDETEFDLRYYANNYGKPAGFCTGKKDGNYINPSNPHSFYQCHQNGVTNELPCVSGTVYDPPPYDRCEWPNQVRGCNGGYGRGCGKAPIQVYPVYSTQPPIKPPRQCNAVCETSFILPDKLPQPYVAQYGRRNRYGG